MTHLRATYAGERRTSHFGFQLTPSERVDLERRAEDRGMVLAEFVRACCLLNHGAGETAGTRPRLPEGDRTAGRAGARGEQPQLARAPRRHVGMLAGRYRLADQVNLGQYR
jgi:mobilization protein NikA